MYLVRFVKEKSTLLVAMLITLVSIRYLDVVSFLVVPTLFILLKRANMYLELFILFFFVLVLSDSYYLPMAAKVKPIIIVLLSGLYLLDQKSFTVSDRLWTNLLPLFIVGLIGLLSSPVFGMSFQRLLSYFLIWFIVPKYALQSAGRTTEQRDLFVADLVTFILILLVSGLVMGVISSDMVIHDTGRFTGVFGNPNGLGLFIGFAIFVVALVNRSTSPLTKWDYVALITAASISLVQCGSRTAIIALIVLGLTYFVNKISIILSVLVATVLLLTGDKIVDGIYQAIGALDLESFFRIETVESGSGRFVAWKFGWDIILGDNVTFFVGNGFSFTDYIYKINRLELSMLGHEGHAHNSYLTFWLDTGIIGLGSFIFGWGRMTWLAGKVNPWGLPLFLAIGVYGFFESTLTASLNPYLIMMVTFFALTSYPVLNEELNAPQDEVQVD